MRLFDFLHHCAKFFAACLVNHIIQVDTNAWHVGRNDHDIEAINFVKFGRFSFRSTGHAGQFVVHSEIILNRNGRVGLGLLLDRAILLRLDRLVQAI